AARSPPQARCQTVRASFPQFDLGLGRQHRLGFVALIGIRDFLLSALKRASVWLLVREAQLVGEQPPELALHLPVQAGRLTEWVVPARESNLAHVDLRSTNPPLDQRYASFVGDGDLELAPQVFARRRAVTDDRPQWEGTDLPFE